MKNYTLLLVLFIIGWTASAQKWIIPETLKIFTCEKMGIFDQTIHSNNQQKTQSFTTSTDRLDSAYLWNWDTQSLSWVLSLKYIYFYDANSNNTVVLQKQMNGNIWVNYVQNLNTYDANNNITISLGQQWDGSSWVNIAQYIYTYDAQNNMTRHLFQNWIGGSWINDRQKNYTYNADNNCTIEMFQTWVSNAWADSIRDAYTYNANDSLVTDTVQIGFHGSIDKRLHLYSYNINNYRSFWDEKRWIGNSWENFSQTFYTYVANNNLMTELSQMWLNNNAWQNRIQYLHTYDSNNNQVGWIFQDWAGYWMNMIQLLNTYDANNNKIAALGQFWDGVNWVNSSSTQFYYDNLTGILNLDEAKIFVYPNPTKGKVTIECNASNRKYELYDATGNILIRTIPFNSKFEIDLSKYKSGIYFLTLGDKGGKVLRKIVKE